jgi:hypothetical protein
MPLITPVERRAMTQAGCEQSVGVTVLRREGDVQIMVVTEPRPPSPLELDGEP